jgi:hypothetical protein
MDRFAPTVHLGDIWVRRVFGFADGRLVFIISKITP